MSHAVAGAGIVATVPAAACGRSSDLRLLVGKVDWLVEQFAIDIIIGDVCGDTTGLTMATETKARLVIDGKKPFTWRTRSRGHRLKSPHRTARTTRSPHWSGDPGA